MCGLQDASVNQFSTANQIPKYSLQLCLQLIRIGYWPLLTYVGHISLANHSSSLLLCSHVRVSRRSWTWLTLAAESRLYRVFLPLLPKLEPQIPSF